MVRAAATRLGPMSARNATPRASSRSENRLPDAPFGGARNARGKADMIKTRITRTAVFDGAGRARRQRPGYVRQSRARSRIIPSRPVRFILPFGAAGVADITARLAAEKLGDKLGQRFVVENQPGPGGIAAARSVLSQPPDGYTIGLVTNGTAISAAIYKALPFDPVKSFAHDLDHRLVRPRLRHQRGVRVQDAAGLHQGGARAAGQAQCRHHQCRRHPEPCGRAVQVAGRAQLPDRPVSRHARCHRCPAPQRRAAAWSSSMRR